MANPSLQIGNSNWAIKESNLLGYSTAGTRFVPESITMTRASAGTRVNSSGLVETVELLGSESVTNGDFATDSNWSKNNGITISGGSANFTGLSGQYLSQNIGLVLGKTYFLSFDVSVFTGGTLTIFAGAGNNLSSLFPVNSTGTYTGSFVAGGVDSKIYFGSLFTGSIDNVSVKESTKNNLARVDYDGTASSLLVEPQRTNLLPYSEDFSSNWTTSNLSVVEHSTTSPSGETNADKLVEDSSNSSHSIRYASPNTPVTNGVVYTMSFFAKKEERTSIRISNAAMSNTNGKFNLSNGQVISSGSSATNSMVDYGNGWYRCIMTFTSTTTIAQANIAILNANNDITYQGDGSSGLYMWGVQIEAGSYGTSYIPTSGSTVTRVQETYSKTGISNLINSEEGVLFGEIAALSDDGTDRQICLRDDTWTNRMFLRLDASSNQITFRYYIGGSLTVNLIHTLTDITIFNKIACKWELNKFKLYVNGDKVAEDLSANVMGADLMNRIAFDDGLGTNVFYGKVKQLQVFKTALTDSELIALTT